MTSLHLKRNGQNIIAVLKNDTNGMIEDCDDLVTDIRPLWLEGEERPVLVELWTSGGDYSRNKNVVVHEIIGSKAVFHHGSFHYMFDDIPYDLPIILEHGEYPN